ncbi:hypothetical protein C8A01DRAFT_31748 [Parachaetomium inaequale]|uniref:Uncharacterized protein n=1 Tax=Parachaetomium inaequale TaxID=2588326 RepID=A0AAN6PSM4_9PEZI|nr:hypothetical protein C8A01DRAFT_31748 [Parachaetomium inaequale]
MPTPAAVLQGLIRLASVSMAILGWLRRAVGLPRGWVALCAIICVTMAVNFLRRLFSSSSDATVDTPFTGTPALTGLPTGVTACGMLLSATVAALVSASSSAPGAAAAANRAFTNLGADDVAKLDWKAVSLEARQRSDEVLEQFYMELRQVEKALAYIRRVAESAAKGVDELHGADKEAQFLPGWDRWVPTWIWGSKSGLAGEKSKVKRMLDSYLNLIKHVRVARALSQDDISSLERYLDLRMATKPNDVKADDTFGNPGVFFQNGIKSLNSDFEPKPAGSTKSRATGRHQQQHGEQDMTKADGSQKVPISMDDPEVASFVMDLHTAQGAGSLFHGSFQNVKMRLQRLSKAMQDEEKFADNTEKDLDRIDRQLGGAKTPEELQPFAEELVSLAKEWLNIIQERYYD